MAQDSGDRHAVHPCGPRIKQDYSRPESNGEFDRRFLIGRHSDNFNVVSGLEQANEGIANLGIAIDNQHANGFMRNEFQCVIPSKAENNPASARSVQVTERRLSVGARIELFIAVYPSRKVLVKAGEVHTDAIQLLELTVRPPKPPVSDCGGEVRQVMPEPGNQAAECPALRDRFRFAPRKNDVCGEDCFIEQDSVRPTMYVMTPWPFPNWQVVRKPILHLRLTAKHEHRLEARITCVAAIDLELVRLHSNLILPGGRER